MRKALSPIWALLLLPVCTAIADDRLTPFDDAAWLPTPPAETRSKGTSLARCEVEIRYPRLGIAFADSIMESWAEQQADGFCFDQTDIPEDRRFSEFYSLDYRLLRPSARVLSVYFEGGSMGAGGPPYMEYNAFNFDLERESLLTIGDVLDELTPGPTTVGSLANRDSFLISPDGLILFESSGLGGVDPWLIPLADLDAFEPDRALWLSSP